MQADFKPFPAPFECPLAQVQEAWIDYNGHMNMAYYSLVFDQALDAVYDALGIGKAYLETSGCSHFTLEAHLRYQREVHLGDPLRITWRLIDWNHKCLHFLEEMYHAEQGWLAATSEQLAIHIDMQTRRSTPFSERLQQRFSTVLASHAAMPPSAQVGRPVEILRKSR